MTDNFEDYRGYVTHLRQEHRRLADCLHRIEQQWLLLDRHPDPAAYMKQISDSLRALRAELAHHFVEEETGGCLEEAVTHQPSLSHEVTRLEHEHPALLAQMDRLIEKLELPNRPAGVRREIETEFQAFTQSLLAHEAAEDRVVEQSFGMTVE